MARESGGSERGSSEVVGTDAAPGWWSALGRAARGLLQSPTAARLKRWIRHGPDRLLHRWRRRRAWSRLAARPVTSVLVVCHGNICRSPYGEAALRAALPPFLRDRIRVFSAGFLGPGRPAPLEAIEVAARRGLDLRPHRSRPLDVDLVRGADLIVVMEPGQARRIQVVYGVDPDAVLVLGDLDPLPIETRAIRDPVLQPVEVFEECYARIDRCVAVLAKAIAVQPYEGR
jgi:protein-tyrosine phosphatase